MTYQKRYLIVAFTEAKTLDEITKHQEYGKRPYQKFLSAIGSALLALVVAVIMGYIYYKDNIIARNIIKRRTKIDLRSLWVLTHVIGVVYVIVLTP